MDSQQLDYPSDPLAHVDWPSDPLGYEEGFHRQDFVEKFPQGGGDTLDYPFKIKKAGEDRVRISSGTISGFGVSGLSGEKIISGTVVLYIRVNYDEEAGTISSRTFLSGISLPSSSPGTEYIEIGTVTESGGLIVNIDQSLSNSLRFAFCQQNAFYWAV